MDIQTVLMHQPKQFQFDFLATLAECRQDSWLPGYRGRVFVPRIWLEDDTHTIIDLESGHGVERSAVTCLNNPLWQQHGLAVGCYPTAPDAPVPGQIPELLTTFRLALVNEQTRVLRKAVEWCQAFLSSRPHGRQTLSSHPVVSQMLAMLIRDAYALMTIDRTWFDTAGGRHYAVDAIDSVCEQLIKLAGGRAMLCGQMVHLRTLFLTLNRLYLEG
jgi:hypothetical protein